MELWDLRFKSPEDAERVRKRCFRSSRDLCFQKISPAAPIPSHTVSYSEDGVMDLSDSFHSGFSILNVNRFCGFKDLTD